jgi:hypothetical protein
VPWYPDRDLIRHDRIDRHRRPAHITPATLSNARETAYREVFQFTSELDVLAPALARQSRTPILGTRPDVQDSAAGGLPWFPLRPNSADRPTDPETRTPDRRKMTVAIRDTYQGIAFAITAEEAVT